MNNSTCIPVSEQKISLNVSDLADWEPYSSTVETRVYNETSDSASFHSHSHSRVSETRRGLPFAAAGMKKGGDSTLFEPQQGSWIRAKAKGDSGGAAPKPPRLDSLLPEDLNISWEFQPLEGKSKVSVQIESQSTKKKVGLLPPVRFDKPSLPFNDSTNEQDPPGDNLGATGKRPNGIGTENVQQEIVSAERSAKGVVLRVTLLAAGFVVGPNGASIHQIEAVTGARVYSFNRRQDRQVIRPTRQFHIEGSPGQVQHAVDVICHAIQLYKDLAEGNHQNVTVKRLHKLDGVLFRYEPPPRSKVPFAAQVGYDAAELRAMQSTRGSRSIHAIKEVREQLARRDEALMRANLPAPARASSRVARGRRKPSVQIELGEPDIQNHDVMHRQLIDDFDTMVSISRTQSLKREQAAPRGLELRPHQPAGASRSIASEGPASRARQDHWGDGGGGNGGGGGGHQPGELDAFSFLGGHAGGYYQDYFRRGDDGGAFRSSPGAWNQGGLYGIDSFFRTK